MIIYCRNDKEFNDLKKWSKIIVKFMQQYEYLINSRTIEFYIENLSTKLPLNWQNYLTCLEPINLAQFLNDELITVNQVMPLSLMCYRRLGKILSFKRQESNLNELNQLKQIFNLDKLSNQNNHCSPYTITDLNQIDLKNIFTRHLKIKKRYEVGRFSSLINNILEETDDVELMDFGSGKGHLDRFLAIYFNYKITSLELEPENSRRANEIDKQTIKYLSKSSKLNYYLNKNKNLVLNNLPMHLNVKVSNDNFNEFNSQNSSCNKKALIALHACGTLSSDIIRLFKEDLGEYLFLISCCYHKCELNSFLLSQSIKDLNYNWNYETKEIACHFIENFIEQLKTNYSKLKINCYRSLLEYIFHHHYPSFRHSELAKVRNFEQLNFVEYVHAATRKLKVNFAEEHLDNKWINQNLANFFDAIKFYALRLKLAPMIENLIQIDRMLYLYEHKIPTALIPIFSPLVSPRNFVIFSYKKIS